MSLPGKSFGDKSPKGNAQALIRIAQSGDYAKAEVAISALAELTSSDEALDCLIALSGSAHDKSAIAALGLFAHPRATQRLLDIIAGGSSAAEKAGVSIGHPRHVQGVRGLLNIALTSRKHESIRLAVAALKAIGTPEALAAIKQFSQQPSRELSITYFETPETIYTSSLGQTPGENEVAAAVKALAETRPFDFLPRADAIDKVKNLIAKPDQPLLSGYFANYAAARAKGAPIFVAHETLKKLTSYPSTISRAAIETCVKAAQEDAPGRWQEIEALISSDQTIGSLKEKLAKGDGDPAYSYAIDFLALIGNKSAIHILLGLSAENLRRGCVIRAVTNAGQGQTLAQMFLALDAAALLDPYVIETIAKAGNGNALVQIFLRDADKLSLQQALALIPALKAVAPPPASLPALQDALAAPHIAKLDGATWAARKELAQSIATIGGNVALEGLKARLANESDYELQQFLKEMITKAAGSNGPMPNA